MIISHTHYDHLDYNSVVQLHNRYDNYYVAIQNIIDFHFLMYYILILNFFKKMIVDMEIIFIGMFHLVQNLGLKRLVYHIKI